MMCCMYGVTVVLKPGQKTSAAQDGLWDKIDLAPIDEKDVSITQATTDVA